MPVEGFLDMFGRVLFSFVFVLLFFFLKSAVRLKYLVIFPSLREPLPSFNQTFRHLAHTGVNCRNQKQLLTESCDGKSPSEIKTNFCRIVCQECGLAEGEVSWLRTV